MGVTTLNMATLNKNDQLCSYAALLLADAGKDVTADDMNTLIKAAGGDVPGYYTQIFEKVAGMRAVSEMVEDASKVGGGAPAAGAAPAAGGDAGAAKKEEKKEESDDDGGADMQGGGLFGEEDDW